MAGIVPHNCRHWRCFCSIHIIVRCEDSRCWSRKSGSVLATNSSNASATVIIITQMQIVRQYFCNSSIVCGKWANNFRMPSNSMNISSLRFWIICIRVDLAHFYAIPNANGCKRVSELANNAKNFLCPRQIWINLFLLITSTDRFETQNRIAMVIHECLAGTISQSIIWWPIEFGADCAETGGKYASHTPMERIVLPLESKYATTGSDLSADTWIIDITRAATATSRRMSFRN